METVLETLMTMTRKSAMVVAPFQKTVQSPQNVGFLKNIFFLKAKRTAATGHESKDVSVSNTHIMVYNVSWIVFFFFFTK